MPDDSAALAPREVVIARLNRLGALPPARLAARRSSSGCLREPVQAAAHPGAADGVRAFGRLALFDNYRLVAQRVRQEIETFLTDDPLAAPTRPPGWGCGRTGRGPTSSPGWPAAPAAGCSSTWPT